MTTASARTITHQCQFYSLRSAALGSTLNARRAGT
jgi:hypothetical protein